MSKKRVSVAGMAAGMAVLLAAALLVPACAQAPAPTVTVTAPAPAPTATVTAPAPTVTVTAPAPTPTPVSTAKFTFTYAWNDVWGPLPQYGRVNRPGGEIQRLLYERSNGRIQLKIISKMFPTLEILAAVAKGEADMGDLATPYFTGTYPIWNWGSIPGLFNTDVKVGLTEMQWVLRDPKLAKVYDKVYREIGLVRLADASDGWGNAVWSNKKITKLDDMKGMKIRTYGVLQVDAFKAWGASPISMAATEIPTALLAGTLDGAYTSTSFGHTSGFHKLTKYINVVPFITPWPYNWSMNAKKYDALPADLQKVLSDTFWEISNMTHLSTMAEFMIIENVLKDIGMELVRLDPAEEAKAVELTKPIEENWLKIAGPYAAEVLKIVKDSVASYRAFKTTP
ncbi:MAG: TRAP transporter substrate-binding protein DctP [Chloroflexi bacterium]|nr:TRAP transporter substrate-binding protein DctP [Chloroflexota bacterium]